MMLKSRYESLAKILFSIINAYGPRVITDAGLPFVSTLGSFNKTYIKPYGGVRSPMWIARYGKNNGKLIEVSTGKYRTCRLAVYI